MDRDIEVVLIDRIDCADTAAAIRTGGGTAVVFLADLTELEAIPSLCENVVAEAWAIGILINNAGIYSFHPVEKISNEVGGACSPPTSTPPSSSRRRFCPA